MDKIINLGIPHVAEQIFEPFGIKDLNECLRVSETWKEIGGEFAVKKWKDNFHWPVHYGATEIVQVLLDHPKCDDIDWNKKENLTIYKTAVGVQPERQGGTITLGHLLAPPHQKIQLYFDYLALEGSFKQIKFFTSVKNRAENLVVYTR